MTAAVLARVDELTDVEAGALVECERVIERGLKTFIDVGRALARIRDERLYRTEYASFESYCRERWSIGRDYADRMITAAGVVPTIVGTGLPAPANEAQARELARIPEAERADVWREARDRAFGRPTAATIRDVVRERQAPKTAAEATVSGPADASGTGPRHGGLGGQPAAAGAPAVRGPAGAPATPQSPARRDLQDSTSPEPSAVATPGGPDQPSSSSSYSQPADTGPAASTEARPDRYRRRARAELAAHGGGADYVLTELAAFVRAVAAGEISGEQLVELARERAALHEALLESQGGEPSC